MEVWIPEVGGGWWCDGNGDGGGDGGDDDYDGSADGDGGGIDGVVVVVVVMVVITPREKGCGPLTKDTSLDYKQDCLARVRNTSIQFSIYQTLLNLSYYKMPMTCPWLSRISQSSRRSKGLGKQTW